MQDHENIFHLKAIIDDTFQAPPLIERDRSEDRWTNFWWDEDICKYYLISEYGEVWDNVKERNVLTSVNQYGDFRVNLNLVDRGRKTVSIRNALGRSFLPDEYGGLYDTTILKDNDKTHLHYSNIAWRPGWYSVAYSRQFQKLGSEVYGGPLARTYDGKHYYTVLEAGIDNGVLLNDVMLSCYRQGAHVPLLETGFTWV